VIRTTLDLIAGRGISWLPAFFRGDFHAELAQPGALGVWKFFAQMGNFSG
jgi:hypothetical protein